MHLYPVLLIKFERSTFMTPKVISCYFSIQDSGKDKTNVWWFPVGEIQFDTAAQGNKLG